MTMCILKYFVKLKVLNVKINVDIIMFSSCTPGGLCYVLFVYYVVTHCSGLIGKVKRS